MAEIKQVFQVEGYGDIFESREAARQFARTQELEEAIRRAIPTLTLSALKDLLTNRPNDMVELMRLARRVTTEEP